MALLLWLGCDAGEHSSQPGSPDDSSTPGFDDTGTSAPDDSGDAFTIANLTQSVSDSVGSIIEVGWEQNAPSSGHVEYRFDPALPTDDWMQSPTRSFPAGAHTELLLGIPYGSTVTWHVVSDPDGDAAAIASPEEAIENEPLPAGVPEPTVLASDPTRMDPTIRWLLGSNNESSFGSGESRYWTFILDRDARVVWAVEAPPNRLFMHVQPSYDGDEILLDFNSFWAIFNNGQNSQIARIKIDGSIVETIDVPLLHHGFTETADHSILWGTYRGDFALDEWLEEKDAAGNERTVWKCEEFQKSIGVDQPCGSNTIFWDPTTDSIYYSFFWTHTVMNIDRKTGSTIRWFGNLPGAYAFNPPESQFWLQHAAHLNADGTFTVSSYTSQNAHENVARVYTIDAGNETLVLDETFGEGDGVYGEFMGEAWLLPNGNFLQNYGTTSRLREGTPEGEIAWDLEWNGNWLGRTTPLTDLYAFAP